MNAFGFKSSRTGDCFASKTAEQARLRARLGAAQPFWLRVDARPCAMHAIAACLLMTCLSTSLIAQQGASSTMIGAPIAAPGNPAGVYRLNDLESVNLYNGNLNLSIPLHTLSGRGDLAIPIGIHVGTRWAADIIPHPDSVTLVYPHLANDQLDDFLPGYLKLVETNETGQCGTSSTLIRLEFRDADRTVHELRDALTDGQPELFADTCLPGSYHRKNRGPIFHSTDSSNIVFTSDTDIIDDETLAASGYLRFPNGTVYRIDGGTISWARDRNGNKSVFTYTPDEHKLAAAQDPQGRTTTITYGLPITTVSYFGTNGATRTISIQYKKLSECLRDGGATKPVKELFQEANISGFPDVNAQMFDPDIISTISLDNGDQYAFQYNVYGEVARFTLPTGGSFEYEWASAWPGNPDGLSISSPIVLRRITERRQYDQGNLIGKTLYDLRSSETPSPIGSSITVVYHFDRDPVDKVLKQTAVDKHYYFQSYMSAVTPVYYAPWLQGREYKTEYYDRTGTSILRTVDNSWKQRDPSTNLTVLPETDQTKENDPRIDSTTVTLEHGKSSSKTYSYSVDPFNNVTDVYEYDWTANGGNSLLRHTKTTYNVDGAYTSSSVNLIHLPLTTTIFDGSGTKEAETIRSYDTTSIQPAAAPQHEDPGTAARGNLTFVDRWLNTSNSYLRDVYTYDAAGSLTKEEHPNNRNTAYKYQADDGSYFASPVLITDALGYETKIAYDSYTGSLKTVTDPNGVLTQYEFDDSLDRLTRIIRAANRTPETESYSYPDQRTIKIYKIQNNQGDLVRSAIIYDGFGRQTERRQYLGSDESTYVSTKNEFDSENRLVSSRNPSKLGDGLDYETQYTYDDLGRISFAIYPDGSVAATSYDENSNTVTDEEGKQRKIATDALGRITDVVEDPNDKNYLTSYTYDARGDLKRVVQGDQQRSFTYDSLGRLVSATNPESGLITYKYDANSNLAEKKDAQNTTCYGQITNGVCDGSGYDNLNRPLLRVYSDGTPAVQWFWDWVRVGSLSALMTRSSAIWYTNYDAMGRVKSSTQAFGGRTYHIDYTYDLAGELKTEIYPSGRVVTMQYDAAQRPNTVFEDVQGQAKIYVDQVAYAPHGALQTFRYGNDLYRSLSFTKRLQWDTLDNRLASDSSQDLLQEKWTWFRNSNVKTIDINNGGSGGVSPITFAQSFTYDSLNRLETAADSGGWTRSYAYDRYGNMWITGSSGITPPIQTPNTPLSYLANNRLNGVPYDSRGNQQSLYNGAHRYEYDAENRVRTVTDTTTNNTETYDYDGLGRRITKSVGQQIQSWYVYDVFDHLIAEYGPSVTLGSASCTTCYLTWDARNDTRLVTNQSGAVVARHDYLPFGEEIGVGQAGRVETNLSNSGWGRADNVNQKFTGKERDLETGLDYFGARYFSAAQGRFTSVDPSMESVILRSPQTWNRYAYSLNNPLRYIDLNGEAWIAAANGTYSWVDQCGDRQMCYQAVAAVSGNSLVVYGSANAKDITSYAANENGYVDMSDVADNADAHFELKDGAASYLSLDHAAGFFNTAEQYHEDHSKDSDLFVTDMGNADGSKLPPHSTHDLGRSIDVRYVDSNGKPIQSKTASDSADVDRISSLIDIAKNHGFKQNYSARPKDFGTSYAKGHESHLHIGASKPPEKKIKPPSK